jgi:SAM-dependent methyltransferase
VDVVNKLENSNSHDLELVKECDLCGGSKFEPDLVANGWSLVRCNGCGLVFTSPRYTERYLQKLYSDRYYERASGNLSMQVDEPSEDEYLLAKTVMKICGIERKGLKLRSLDIGCGGGRIVEAFQDSGWEAVGTDLSLKAVNAGIKRGLDLRVLDLDSPELGEFDLITGFHILEHVHSPRKFLSQCTKRLGSNGYLLIEVPDYGSRQASRMGSSWPYLYPDGHLYQLTIDTLSKYIAKGKFEVIQIQKVQGRGFLEDYSTCPASKSQYRSKLKSFLFSLRHIVYWSPACRRVVRHIYWHTLGYGEFIRVLARKLN